MNQRNTALLLGIVWIGLLPQLGHAQSYSPYTPPIIGDIQTQCVETAPTPQSRTDVGIGEQVTCWIGSWTDTDIYTDAYQNQYYVQDKLGSITWSTSGPGSIYPTVTYDSTPVTLAIDMVDEDDTVTISALVKDSGTMGVDPPQQKQKALNVKIPRSILAVAVFNTPDPMWKPGNANLGASGKLFYQVAPNTVNFNNVSFRTNFPDIPTYAWPDGTKDPKKGAVGNAFNTVNNDPANPNIAVTKLTQSLQPVARINGDDWTFNWAGTLERLNTVTNKWVGAGGVGLYIFSIQFTAAKNQTAVGLIWDTTPIESSSPQGPWQ